MVRKPIFDALRRILGGRLTEGQVRQIDRAIDDGERSGTGDPASDTAAEGSSAGSSQAYELGSLSARYECGDRGPGAVSSGKNDPGGISYGLFQLSSRTGTCAAFVAAEGRAWRTELAAAPGSAEFGEAWKAVAAAQPQAFAAAQRAFIARTHYLPAVNAVLASTRLDLGNRRAALRDVCWSVAVQHGAAARILITAVAAADAAGDREALDYDRRLIEAIYAERTAHVLRVATRPGTAPATRRLLESIVRGRLVAERAEALAMLAAEAVPA